MVRKQLCKTAKRQDAKIDKNIGDHEILISSFLWYSWNTNFHEWQDTDFTETAKFLDLVFKGKLHNAGWNRNAWKLRLDGQLVRPLVWFFKEIILLWEIIFTVAASVELFAFTSQIPSFLRFDYFVSRILVTLVE